MGAEACEQEGKLYYYHKDEQSSTALITGEDAVLKNAYQYDAFGVIKDKTEGISNRIRYIGQQYDPVTEQYYLRARFYHPGLGRFLQEDPYRGDGLNLYAYCDNNPVMYYYPSGYAANSHDNKEKNGNEGSGVPDGYSQDANGKWHRPNGDFASNAEMGIQKADSNTGSTHGNSFDYEGTNYGYALVDKNTGEILKFGETINPDTRYS